MDFNLIIAAAIALWGKLKDPTLSIWQKTLAGFEFFQLIAPLITPKKSAPVGFVEAQTKFASAPPVMMAAGDDDDAPVHAAIADMQSAAAAGLDGQFFVALLNFIQQVMPFIAQLLPIFIKKQPENPNIKA